MEQSYYDILNGKRLVLGSASPRRRQLVGELDIPVTLAQPIDVRETYPASLPAEKIPSHVCHLKAEAYKNLVGPDDILLTADTIVICDGKPIGKPKSLDQARTMLQALSGRTHMVITAVNLLYTDSDGVKQNTSFNVHTDVEFDELSIDEINHYINKYQPLDRAGAYGIQDWIGFIGVKAIHGDYYNVMGLPLNALYHALKKIGKS